MFPDAAALASQPVEAIAAVGMPKARARTIAALAKAVADGLDLSPRADVESIKARLARKAAAAQPGLLHGKVTCPKAAQSGGQDRTCLGHADIKFERCDK